MAKPKLRKLITTEVRGIEYRSDVRWMRELKPKTRLHIEREPDNSFDSHAVRVHSPGPHHLGYLPREIAPIISKLLQLGFPIHARVVEVVPRAAWLKIDVWLLF